MRNKCNIVRDLLPLYVEDMASADSVSYVNEHLQTCAACCAEYKRMKSSARIDTSFDDSVDEKIIKRSFQVAKRKFTRHAQLVSLGIVLIGLTIGLSLGFGIEMFLNALIMPIIGVFGYVVFRWKALYKTPILLTVLYAVGNFINYLLQFEYLEFVGFIAYAFIYSTFLCVGVLIAGLLHFAFKKEEK